MPTTEKNTQWYQTKFHEFEQGLNGEKSTPLHTLRRNAIEQFAAIGFPTTKQEEWRFTNVSPVSKIDFQPVLRYEREGMKEADIAAAFLPDAIRLVFINGFYSPEFSDVRFVPKNVVIENLAAAKKKYSELLQQSIGKGVKTDENAFTALNTAFIQDGAFVHVPKGVVVEKPLQLLFVSTQNTSPFISLPRNILRVDENAQLTVFEHYFHRADNIYCTNVATDFFLGEHANVEHVKLQTESINAFHISNTVVRQQTASVYRSNSIALGGSIARNNVTALLDAEHVECTLNGLTLAAGTQLIDHHTTIDHANPNCISHELYKYVLDEKARGVFNGKVYVRKDAQKTDAKQTNKTLLLSDEATIDTKPQLEMHARCGGGAVRC
jgi:Fe-S cluster assembly protein SufD